MLTVHVLGSGSGLPTARRDTTSLLVVGPDGSTLVDCPGGVVHKLARVGVRVDQLTRVVLTHDHVDHVYGFPHLLHAMSVFRAVRTLVVHAPEQTVATIAELIRVHRLDGQGYPQVELRPVAMAPGVAVIEHGGLRVTAAPAEHGRDTLALRFDTEQASFGHSSDTRRSLEVARLMRDVDLLMHDCGGLHAQVGAAGSPHASARDAGEIAARAGAGALRLIHLSPDAELDETALVSEARERFAGSVEAAYDGAIYRLPRADRAGTR